jgi:hypothetical protein
LIFLYKLDQTKTCLKTIVQFDFIEHLLQHDLLRQNNNITFEFLSENQHFYANDSHKTENTQFDNNLTGWAKTFLDYSLSSINDCLGYDFSIFFFKFSKLVKLNENTHTDVSLKLLIQIQWNFSHSILWNISDISTIFLMIMNF